MGASFVSQRDYVTLSNPTRPKKPKPQEPAAEALEWKSESLVLSMMQVGFDYYDAFHLCHRDARRYGGIHTAWSIPSDDREGGTRVGTAQDAAQLFRTG